MGLYGRYVTRSKQSPYCGMGNGERKGVGDKFSFLVQMKNPNRQTVTKLTDLPNIGKAIAGDLRLVGLDSSNKCNTHTSKGLYSFLMKSFIC
jgi:hypothetical protein